MCRILTAALVVALAVASGAACGPAGKPTSGPAASAADAAFEKLADTYYWAHFDFRPADAIELGWHQYDGKLPDRSPAAIAREIERLQTAAAQLDALDPAALSHEHRLEREVLVYLTRSERFTLEKLDAAHKNPAAYMSAVNLAPYIIRDYAPIGERARALVSSCTAMPGYLAQARENVEKAVPRTWLELAILQARGHAEFMNGDMRKALAGKLGDAALETELSRALDVCVAAVSEHATYLEGLRPQANDAFALGEQRFLDMLAETQGVRLDLAALEKIALADLDRNFKAMEEAARAIDPKRPVAEIVLAAAEENKPAADGVVPLATAQAKDMRQFLLDKKIVSIPSEDVAEVRESPPFQRWNAAFLDGAGPFEKKKLKSFYYISPPDPSWPAAEQRAYIPPALDLLFVTVHELWPGHFLHALHIAKHPSRIMKSFCTYSMSEGWAHYTEEMMFEAGAAGADPKARVGMLKEALLRNVRFVAAIGLHTKGMTVDEATRMFAEKAFADPGNARQQAVRGTFDPMYVSYTVGKLMIVKLRDDWKARQGAAYELGAFHDAFLGHACAPIPLIRAELLGGDAGGAL